MNTLSQVQAYVTYWTAQPDSEQRTTVLAYWVNQAQKFIKYSRRNVNGELVNNTAAQVKAATKLVSKFFGVPQRKQGECRYDSMMRLTYLQIV